VEHVVFMGANCFNCYRNTVKRMYEYQKESLSSLISLTCDSEGSYEPPVTSLSERELQRALKRYVSLEMQNNPFLAKRVHGSVVLTLFCDKVSVFSQ